ncbi:hypothetical protein OWR29_26165 [Actinoplanes sp. Pm04-4]|uniref:Uncharacterized protein n=1 Tax=Paractinoplanes pyxinae TaxID=2997416 RepID=A0ABT4B4S4_9ACTN|nr:hypothetical protein [Actinoplanes pyxinae]MCY1141497.1 hypothetical protein [Actinoplanes pyxinae]
MTRTVESALHHRPFATLLRPRSDDTPLPADAVRAEIRALVTRGALGRRDGADLLARLGLQVSPYRWAVAVSVPVSVTITAPNNRYAVQAGIGQLVAALGRLRTGYLTQPGAITAPTDQPARRSLSGVTYRRTEACPGYPVGGIYQISADAQLATMVSADTATAAYAGAIARLAAELDRLTGVDAQPSRMRQLGAHRFTGLDDPPDTTAAGSPEPGTAPAARRPAEAAQQ